MARNITTVFLAVAVIVAAVALNLNTDLYCDPSWLISATGRWLSGQKLYVEVIETNPPLIIYLTVPPVLIARFLEVAPEAVFVIYVTLLGIASLIAVSRIYPEKWFVIFSVLVIFLFPAQHFGQREHLAIILFLPYFASLMAGKKANILTALFAGIGLAIKPYLIFLAVACVLGDVITTRNLRAAFSRNNFIIFTVFALYTAAVTVFHPEYFRDVVPPLLKYYAIYGHEYSYILKRIYIILGGLTVPLLSYIVLCWRNNSRYARESIYTTLLILAATFTVLVQAKGWVNHFYVMVVFGCYLCVFLIGEVFRSRKKLLQNIIYNWAVALLVIQIALAVQFNYERVNSYNEKEQREIASVLTQYAAGKYVYPVTFGLCEIYPAFSHSQAVSASRYAHLFVQPGIYFVEGTAGITLKHNPRDKRNADEQKSIDHILEDLRHHEPELLLVSEHLFRNKYKFDFIEYLSIEPEFVKIFNQYIMIKKVGNMTIYQRKK